MVSSRSVFRRAVAPLGAGAAIAVAMSACIGNPGAFEVAVQGGSTITFKDATGQPSVIFSHGLPACGDNLDNDADGLLDGADGNCVDANDNNERLAGAQAFARTEFTINIDAAGAVTVDPTTFASQPIETCYEGLGCLAVSMNGVGSVQAGSFDGTTGVLTLPLPFDIDIDATDGFAGLGADCHIGTINGVFTSSGYDPTTGEAVLQVTNVATPAAADCGTTYDDLFDGVLGLPGTISSTLNTTILDGSGDPITLD